MKNTESINQLVIFPNAKYPPAGEVTLDLEIKLYRVWDLVGAVRPTCAYQTTKYGQQAVVPAGLVG